MNIEFSSHELRDLAIAWIALSIAFAIFFAGGGQRAIFLLGSGQFGLALLVSLLTAGVAFLLHEVAHKVVAIRFGQVAEFRADYGMLGVAIMSALVGFIFAAPGAVYHRGMLTEREHGLIALAGPAMNLALVVVFVPIFLAGLVLNSGIVELVGSRGLVINAFLAAFNMLPIASLDGRTVISWSKTVFAGVFALSAALTVLLVLFVGI
ncbi:metalloprotease [Haloferax sp. DFSO60]|uniref:metalloprotease n=1 Tax=Haloferax sp. DFSO60 TaxID=3388652 RepID=UPI003978FAD3